MLFLIFFFINWWVTRTLWKPFYQTVESLKSFRANSDERPSFQTTAIKEFSELNKSVQAMMDKMIADFNSQKQFTENASHEMQTPLAVIRTKMDLLIQSENLGKKETDLILSIDDACTKLGRLNKSLLLLTKIENRQFKESEKVWLNGVLKNALELFSEHIAFKNIHLTIDIDDDVFISINPDLSFMLISNLMQNAIRHNFKDGEVKIKLNKERLSISNTSCALPIISSKLFERFQKSSTSTDSLGLGLAIAKEIADASNLLLEYKYESNRHKFSVLFNKI
jgi:signal transduction histidine kinase